MKKRETFKYIYLAVFGLFCEWAGKITKLSMFKTGIFLLSIFAFINVAVVLLFFSKLLGIAISWIGLLVTFILVYLCHARYFLKPENKWGLNLAYTGLEENDKNAVSNVVKKIMLLDIIALMSFLIY